MYKDAVMLALSCCLPCRPPHCRSFAAGSAARCPPMQVGMYEDAVMLALSFDGDMAVSKCGTKPVGLMPQELNHRMTHLGRKPEVEALW